MNKLKFWQKAKDIVVPLVWAFLAMSLSQLVVGLLMVWLLGDSFSRPPVVLVYYILSYTLALVLVLLLPPRVSHVELGFKDLPTLVDVGLAPIAYVCYMVVAAIFTNLMSNFSWFNANEAQQVGFSGYFLSTSDRICAILALVFIAPIVEEIIMRGWLYGKLRNHLKAPLAMLLVSTLLALLHGQWNVAVSVFVLSFALCGLREITGTIWSGILLHMLVNSVAFFQLYIAF